jgi:hypothetical protein
MVFLRLEKKPFIQERGDFSVLRNQDFVQPESLSKTVVFASPALPAAGKRPPTA